MSSIHFPSRSEVKWSCGQHSPPPAQYPPHLPLGQAEALGDRPRRERLAQLRDAPPGPSARTGACKQAYEGFWTDGACGRGRRRRGHRPMGGLAAFAAGPEVRRGDRRARLLDAPRRRVGDAAARAGRVGRSRPITARASSMIHSPRAQSAATGTASSRAASSMRTTPAKKVAAQSSLAHQASQKPSPPDRHHRNTRAAGG